MEGKQSTFSGIVDRFGLKSRITDAPTLMLKDVRDVSGRVVTGHLWLPVETRLQALNLQIGDEIVFDARVTRYKKRQKGTRFDVYSPLVEIDYQLSALKRIRKIERQDAVGGP